MLISGKTFDTIDRVRLLARSSRDEFGRSATVTIAPLSPLKAAARRLRAKNPERVTNTAGLRRRQHPAYENITDVIDSLEDISKEENWDLEKRLEIARMACENPTTTFEQIEARYDRGFRSVLDKVRQPTPAYA